MDTNSVALLRVVDVALRLGVTVNQVYRLAADGVLPAVHVGGALRFDPAVVDSWVASGGARGPTRRGKKSA